MPDAPTNRFQPASSTQVPRSRNPLKAAWNLPTFASLHVRDYRLLWLGQVFSSNGQWMDQVTRGWLIYHMTGSALQLGLATALRGLPFLFFGVIAGVIADRTGRKLQLVVAQGTNAILNLALAILVLTGLVQPWHVYLTAFLAGTVQAFQQPARQTLIGDIVGDRNLMNALALSSAALNGARAIGPAIAGLLIAFSGAEGSYFVQALLYVCATLWTLQMAIPQRSEAAMRRTRQPFVKSAGEGLAYVAKDTNIRMLMIIALAPVALAMPYSSLMPIFATDVLHGGPRLQGLLLTCIGAGSLLGAIVVASMRREYGYGLSVVIGAVAFGLGLAAFSFSTAAGLSCGIGFIVGIFSVTYQTQIQTLLQTLAPRRLRGRVMSIYLLNAGLVPLGTLLAGALAEAYGGPVSLLILSSASVAVVLLVVAFSPRIIRLRVGVHNDSDAEA